MPYRFRADRFFPVCAVSVLCLAMAAPAGHGQTSADFVPVTDAMLLDPAPADWLMWRRTLDGQGYSPLEQITRENVGELRMVWSRGMGPGSQQATPLAYRGVLYVPNPRDVIQAIDAATGDLLWEYRRDLPDDTATRGLATTNRNLAIYENRIIDTSADGYVFALDAATGRQTWETQILDYEVHPGAAELRADHRRRQGDFRSELLFARRTGGLRHRRPRRDDRRGAVAAAHDTGPRRAGRRDLGRGAVRGAKARRRLDGPELRPRAEPGLHRHVGHLSRAEVHARRRRPGAPLPQLHPGAGRGYRRDRLVLPAPERPLGPRPPVRAAPRRHRRRTGSRGGGVDQPRGSRTERCARC